MKIELDEQLFHEAVRKQVDKAVESGVNSWQMQSALSDGIKEVISTLGIPRLVQEKLQEMISQRLDQMVKDAVEASVGAFTVGISKAVREVAATMIYGILIGKPSEYNSAQSRVKWNEAEQMVSVTLPVLPVDTNSEKSTLEDDIPL